VLANAEDGDDVRVVQPGRRLRFALETRAQRLVGEKMRRQHLERDPPAKRLLHRLVHHAHAAAADLADDAELADLFRQ
jgi:hypothetical protein